MRNNNFAPPRPIAPTPAPASVSKVITPRDQGKGQLLRDLLCRELNIPPMTVWFEVRFAFDETIRVTCSYHATDEEAE